MKIDEITFGTLVKKGAKKVGQAIGSTVKTAKDAVGAFATGYKQKAGQTKTTTTQPSTVSAPSATVNTQPSAAPVTGPVTGEPKQTTSTSTSTTDAELNKIIKIIDNTASLDTLKQMEKDLQALQKQKVAAAQAQAASKPAADQAAAQAQAAGNKKPEVAQAKTARKPAPQTTIVK